MCNLCQIYNTIVHRMCIKSNIQVCIYLKVILSMIEYSSLEVLHILTIQHNRRVYCAVYHRPQAIPDVSVSLCAP